MTDCMGNARWHLLDGRRLLFRAWDDDSTVVCYDTFSGDTHLLNPVAAQTLLHLQQDGALQLDALLKRVAASIEMDATPELQSAIEHILSEFSERGVLAHA